jgi:hypothetical protein
MAFIKQVVRPSSSSNWHGRQKPIGMAVTKQFAWRTSSNWYGRHKAIGMADMKQLVWPPQSNWHGGHQAIGMAATKQLAWRTKIQMFRHHGQNALFQK